MLQRALAICLLVCLPIAALWSRADALIVALGQPPEIAHGAARYLMCVAPALPLVAVSECLKR